MSFSSDAKGFISELAIKHAENVHNTEKALYSQIVLRSPVDTGAYRANHNRSADLPNFSFNKNKTSGTSSPPPKSKNLVYYISNGAPYANGIEHGGSKQAGKGVYGVSANSIKARLR